MIIMLFFESILSIRLTEMGIDEDYVGKFTWVSFIYISKQNFKCLRI
jgi:hypothetical protein